MGQRECPARAVCVRDAELEASSKRMRARIEANTRSRDNVILTFDSRRNTGAVDRVARIGLLSNYTSTPRTPSPPPPIRQLNQGPLYAGFLHVLDVAFIIG